MSPAEAAQVRIGDILFSLFTVKPTANGGLLIDPSNSAVYKPRVNILWPMDAARVTSITTKGEKYWFSTELADGRAVGPVIETNWLPFSQAGFRQRVRAARAFGRRDSK